MSKSKTPELKTKKIIIADELIEQKQYEEGLELYKQEASYGNVYACVQAARILNMEEEYTDAWAYINQALKIDPKSFTANVVAGIILYDNGEDYRDSEDYKTEEALTLYKGAVYYFGEALSINPESSNTYNRKGLALSKEAECYLDLGDAYRASELYAESIAYFTQALNLDSDLGEAYENRSKAYDALGMKAEADKDLSWYINYYKPDPEYFLKYGLNALEYNNTKDALSFFSRTLSIDPGNIKANINKADILFFIGDHEEAIKYVDQVLKIEPEHELAKNILYKIQHPSPSISVSPIMEAVQVEKIGSPSSLDENDS